MVTHLCRISLYKILVDGTQIVNFTDIESNLRLTLKLSKDNPVLLRTDDKGLILFELYIKGGRASYPELPEVSVAIIENERFSIAAGISMCFATVLAMFVLFLIL